MTKSELKALIRECLKEELKGRRLVEGHTIHSLGNGYYADINDDQLEDGRDPKDVEAVIYKKTSDFENPRHDEYITTVKTLTKAQEYVDDLFAVRVPRAQLKRAVVKCCDCGANIEAPKYYVFGEEFTCPSCGVSLCAATPITYYCSSCDSEVPLTKDSVEYGRSFCPKCKFVTKVVIK